MSLEHFLFPDQYKIAKLKSLFDKGSKSDLKIYRPILLLPVLCKIIEKTVHIKTQKYLDQNGLLNKYQSGFRVDFLTNPCLLQLTDFILKGMGKGFNTAMILADLQKTFETLDYTVLLQKMECIGFK